MIHARYVVALAVAAVGLSACSSPADAPSPTPPPETSTSAPLGGDAILIETMIADARLHTGVVLDGSLIGEAAFCSGGQSTGSSEGPTITTTFSCPEGTLTVQYAPTQNSLVQSAPWEVVSGTGSFEGLRGGGFMVAAFTSDDPDSGQEIFTGTVSH